MSLRPVLALALVCAAAGVARAERAVQLDVEPGVAVAASELQAALRVRLAAGPAIAVRVRGVRAGVVVVMIGGREREVAIGALTGGEAARLIALAAADLALDDLATAPADVAVVGPRGEVHAAPRVATQISLALTGSVSAWPDALVGGGLDVALARGVVPDRHAWLAFAEVDAGTLATGDLHLTGATARVGLGLRAGALELRAGVTASPLWVSTGAGDQTVLVGGTAGAQLRLPLGPRTRVVLAAGADAFATHSEYRISATTTAATPWFAPYVAAGVEIIP